jgi:hypothetical protein
MSNILSANIQTLVDDLVRGVPADVIAYLTQIETNLKVNDTRASVHCHVIGLDGQHLPRVPHLARFLAYKVMEYAIPRSEIERAKKHYDDTGSPSKFAELHIKAKNLFSELKNSGEGGELLLYILTEYFLGLPQVMCKMPHKTNAQMHYHGVDGIHASIDSQANGLALYWGESKLYQNVNSAIDACLESIQPFLNPSSAAEDPRERDLYLMRDNLDLNNPQLEAAIQRFLNPDEPKYKQLEYRGVCLIGFDHSAYPDMPHAKKEMDVCEEIKRCIQGWLEKLKESTIKARLNTFILEVFFVPFPSVQDFREAFAKEIG